MTARDLPVCPNCGQPDAILRELDLVWEAYTDRGIYPALERLGFRYTRSRLDLLTWLLRSPREPKPAAVCLASILVPTFLIALVSRPSSAVGVVVAVVALILWLMGASVVYALIEFMHGIKRGKRRKGWWGGPA